jgi:NAD(P)-dependent dehydrogenase (short-subunit alcohol dehydrogenase family)
VTLPEGTTAVITGGGQGIGAAVARALAQAGAEVLVAGRTMATLDKVVGELREAGLSAHALRLDVTDDRSVTRFAGEAIEILGHVDILVNNAGQAHSAPLHRTSLEDWERMMAGNATGTFLCTKAFMGGMLERHWGRVINIASVAGLGGAKYISAYSAAKHAVLGLTRSVAAEVAAQGVTVNAICPGYVNTPMTEASVATIIEKTGKSREDALSAILQMTPMGRLIEPEEVAHAVVMLAAPEAKGITGQSIVIDGGGMPI